MRSSFRSEIFSDAGGSAMPGTLSVVLQREQERIEKIAREMGLTFFRVVFEMVDWREMNALAAYGGFPDALPALALGHGVRRAGEELRVRAPQDLRDGDQQRSHLCLPPRRQRAGRSEARDGATFTATPISSSTTSTFAHTNRKMIDTMANHATRVRRHQESRGIETVERFMDACLSVEELIDPGAVFREPRRAGTPVEEPEQQDPGRMPAKAYLDRYVNPRTTWRRSGSR